MVPKGVEPIPLFQTSSFFVEKDTIDFVGEQYEHFTFDVHMKVRACISVLSFNSGTGQFLKVKDLE